MIKRTVERGKIEMGSGVDFNDYALLCERHEHGCKATNCPLSKENTGYECQQYIRKHTEEAAKLIRIGLFQTEPVQTNVPCCEACTYKYVVQNKQNNLEYYCMYAGVGNPANYRRIKNGGKLTTSPNWCPKRKVNGGSGE